MRLTKIKLKRLETGRQQIVVAQAAGISRSRLSEIENGHVAARGDELARLARSLGCPVDEFVEAVHEDDQ